MTMGTDHIRRRLLRTAGAGLLLAAPYASLAARLAATPRETPGPFYPDSPPADNDNNLLRVAGAEGQARGTPTDLRGRILDSNGQPVTGARVEIWQCDANGRYHHQDDPHDARLDRAFQGFGRTTSDAEGGYRFTTIKPVPYTGRTPHIHFKVMAPGAQPLTTQMYVAGEPGNAEDFLYQRLTPAERGRLTVTLNRDAATGTLTGLFDIIIA